jgi:hypothetical protein
MDTPEEGFGWKEAQREGDFTNNFSIYTYMPKNIYMGPLKCIWQIFTLASGECKCEKKKKLCNRISAIVKNLDKCKSFTLTWDLHAVYTAIDTYTHNTG